MRLVGVQCDSCQKAEAARGNWHMFWHKMKARGWMKGDKQNVHICPVCAKKGEDREKDHHHSH